MAAHRLTTALARSGALLATAGAVHAAVNARALRVPPTQPVPITERVSLLLPVRDEAHRVGPCLRSLLDQRRVPDLEVLVLDDGSSDGTADVVRAVLATTRGSVCSPARLPPRGKSVNPRFETGAASGGEWLGKPWACAQLADAATGSVLVWVDADVVLEPLAIASTVALLREAGLDLVSPYPLQLADGALPRLLQPLLQWSWLTTLPLRVAERSPRPSLAAANGQLLAVDAAPYRASRAATAPSATGSSTTSRCSAPSRPPAAAAASPTAPRSRGAGCTPPTPRRSTGGPRGSPRRSGRRPAPPG